MRFKAACIDCDGTIVDSEQHHWRAWQKTLAEWGVELSFQEFNSKWLGNGAKYMTERLNDLYHISASADELISKKNETYRQLCESAPMPLIAGIEDTLKTLQAQGIKMAVVSAGQKHNVWHAIESSGLRHYFDVVITAADVTNNKPAPDCYLEGCRQLGFKPLETFAIEDSPTGIVSAKEAGLFCYGLRHPHVTKDRLQAADVLLDSHRAILNDILDNESSIA